MVDITLQDEHLLLLTHEKLVVGNLKEQVIHLILQLILVVHFELEAEQQLIQMIMNHEDITECVHQKNE
jgi:hypothetical protein